MRYLQFLLFATFTLPLLISAGTGDDTTSVSLLVEEVEIKSIKRDRDYMQLPLAVSSIGVNTMRNNSIEGIRDISAVVPNLYISNYGTKLSSSVYIRGVGSRINSPSVGLYVDGMPYFEKSSFDFDFNGIESVEVMRGPQGTLYGRNTLGGVINVYTRSPLKYKGTDLSFETGRFGTYKASASNYGQIGDKFGYGASVNYSHNDGFFENLYTGAKADKSDQGSACLRLAYRLSDSLTLELLGSLDLVNQLGYPYAQYDPQTGEIGSVNYNAPSYYKRTLATAGMALKYTHRHFELASQTSYLYVDDTQGVDQDFSVADNFFALQHQHQNTISQEVNISGKLSNRYRWLFGAFGFYQKQNNRVELEYRQQGQTTDKHYDMPTYGVALYHQSIIDDIFVKGLSLTLGLRYDFERGEQDYMFDRYKGGGSERVEQFSNSANFNQFMPKVALQYNFKGVNIYTTVARGYKAGGFNTSFVGEEEASFKPEYTWNYEVGFKHSCWNNRIRSEVALFYIDWKDQQVYQSIATGMGTMLRNAGHSTSKGVEVSLYIRPIKSLNLRANYGYTHAVFNTYQKSDKDDLSGNYLPFVPRNSVGLNADYTVYTNRYLDNILLGMSYIGQGDIFWDDANKIKEQFYGLLNARVAFAMKYCTIELWGRNLTNKNYFAFQFQSMGKSYVQQGRPLTVGVTLRVKI